MLNKTKPNIEKLPESLGVMFELNISNVGYSWMPATWQGGHVDGQYNKQFFEEFT